MLVLNKVLYSSRAAIDLASIMVGVIIIGLIGGVIAATVFAVIPWSQDKAAKQQLDSIHTAESAFLGLSSDPSQDLTNGKKNSFANSAELAAANLLTENGASYCVVSSEAKSYTAYTKSASGKIFKATPANKTPVVVPEGESTCMGEGTGNPETPTPTAPSASLTPGVLMNSNYYGGAAFVNQNDKTYGWGSNGAYAVNSSGVSISTPVVVTNPRFVQIENNRFANYTLAIDTEGKLWSWGNNSSRLLGLGNSTTNQTVPVKNPGVINNKTVVDISAGTSAATAVTSDGTVYSWGSNLLGRETQSSTTLSGTPLPVEGSVVGKKIVSTSSGSNFTIVLDEAGKAYTWGANTYGQFGTGTASPYQTDASRTTMSTMTFKEIVVGDAFAAGLTTSNEVFSWGQNTRYQVGTGAAVNSTNATPKKLDIPLQADETIVGILATYSGGTVLTSTSSMYTWGAHGDATGKPINMKNSSYDMTVLEGKTITAMSAGYNFWLAQTSEGKIYSWGSSVEGRIGNGSTASALVSPYEVKLP
jgi:alpha-tubulin suppressor-like RCC1 family protein